MSTTTINRNADICHPDASHRVVRGRGNRVRRQCDACAKIGPWEKLPKTIKGPLDFHSITIGDPNGMGKVTKVSTPNPPISNEVSLPGDRSHFEKWTVATLRDYCKTNNITGIGSKSTKAMIIDRIMEDLK